MLNDSGGSLYYISGWKSILTAGRKNRGKGSQKRKRESYADYSFVEDDAELDGVIKVFDEILDDIDLEV